VQAAAKAASTAMAGASAGLARQQPASDAASAPSGSSGGGFPPAPSASDSSFAPLLLEPDVPTGYVHAAHTARLVELLTARGLLVEAAAVAKEALAAGMRLSPRSMGVAAEAAAWSGQRSAVCADFIAFADSARQLQGAVAQAQTQVHSPRGVAPGDALEPDLAEEDVVGGQRGKTNAPLPVQQAAPSPTPAAAAPPSGPAPLSSVVRACDVPLDRLTEVVCGLLFHGDLAAALSVWPSAAARTHASAARTVRLLGRAAAQAEEGAAQRTDEGEAASAGFVQSIGLQSTSSGGPGGAGGAHAGSVDRELLRDLGRSPCLQGSALAEDLAAALAASGSAAPGSTAGGATTTFASFAGIQRALADSVTKIATRRAQRSGGSASASAAASAAIAPSGPDADTAAGAVPSADPALLSAEEEDLPSFVQYILALVQHGGKLPNGVLPVFLDALVRSPDAADSAQTGRVATYLLQANAVLASGLGHHAASFLLCTALSDSAADGAGRGLLGACAKGLASQTSAAVAFARTTTLVGRERFDSNGVEIAGKLQDVFVFADRQRIKYSSLARPQQLAGQLLSSVLAPSSGTELQAEMDATAAVVAPESVEAEGTVGAPYVSAVPAADRRVLLELRCLDLCRGVYAFVRDLALTAPFPPPVYNGLLRAAVAQKDYASAAALLAHADAGIAARRALQEELERTAALDTTGEVVVVPALPTALDIAEALADEHPLRGPHRRAAMGLALLKAISPFGYALGYSSLHPSTLAAVAHMFANSTEPQNLVHATHCYQWNLRASNEKAALKAGKEAAAAATGSASAPLPQPFIPSTIDIGTLTSMLQEPYLAAVALPDSLTVPARVAWPRHAASQADIDIGSSSSLGIKFRSTVPVFTRGKTNAPGTGGGQNPALDDSFLYQPLFASDAWLDSARKEADALSSETFKLQRERMEGVTTRGLRRHPISGADCSSAARVDAFFGRSAGFVAYSMGILQGPSQSESAGVNRKTLLDTWSKGYSRQTAREAAANAIHETSIGLSLLSYLQGQKATLRSVLTKEATESEKICWQGGAALPPTGAVQPYHFLKRLTLAEIRAAHRPQTGDLAFVDAAVRASWSLGWAADAASLWHVASEHQPITSRRTGSSSVDASDNARLLLEAEHNIRSMTVLLSPQTHPHAMAAAKDAAVAASSPNAATNLVDANNEHKFTPSLVSSSGTLRQIVRSAGIEAPLPDLWVGGGYVAALRAATATGDLALLHTFQRQIVALCNIFNAHSPSSSAGSRHHQELPDGATLLEFPELAAAALDSVGGRARFAREQSKTAGISVVTGLHVAMARGAIVAGLLKARQQRNGAASSGSPAPASVNTVVVPNHPHWPPQSQREWEKILLNAVGTAMSRQPSLRSRPLITSAVAAAAMRLHVLPFLEEYTAPSQQGVSGEGGTDSIHPQLQPAMATISGPIADLREFPNKALIPADSDYINFLREMSIRGLQIPADAQPAAVLSLLGIPPHFCSKPPTDPAEIAAAERHILALVEGAISGSLEEAAFVTKINADIGNGNLAVPKGKVAIAATAVTASTSATGPTSVTRPVAAGRRYLIRIYRALHLAFHMKTINPMAEAMPATPAGTQSTPSTTVGGPESSTSARTLGGTNPVATSMLAWMYHCLIFACQAQSAQLLNACRPVIESAAAGGTGAAKGPSSSSNRNGLFAPTSTGPSGVTTSGTSAPDLRKLDRTVGLLSSSAYQIYAEAIRSKVPVPGMLDAALSQLQTHRYVARALSAPEVLLQRSAVTGGSGKADEKDSLSITAPPWSLKSLKSAGFGERSPEFISASADLLLRADAQARAVRRKSGLFDPADFRLLVGIAGDCFPRPTDADPVIALTTALFVRSMRAAQGEALWTAFPAALMAPSFFGPLMQHHALRNRSWFVARLLSMVPQTAAGATSLPPPPQCAWDRVTPPWSYSGITQARNMSYPSQGLCSEEELAKWLRETASVRTQPLQSAACSRTPVKSLYGDMVPQGLSDAESKALMQATVAALEASLDGLLLSTQTGPTDAGLSSEAAGALYVLAECARLGILPCSNEAALGQAIAQSVKHWTGLLPALAALLQTSAVGAGLCSGARQRLVAQCTAVTQSAAK
jgi:hypothetical protein